MDTNEIMSSKQSTIGDLYAIRAGLSYISELKDSIDAKNAKIKFNHDEIENCKRAVSDNDLAIKKQKDIEGSLELKHIVADAEKTKAEKTLRETEKAPLSSFGSIDKVYLALLIVSLIVFVGFIAFCVFFAVPEWIEDAETLRNFLIVNIPIAIGLLIWIIRNIKNVASDVRYRRNKKSNEIEKIKEEIERYTFNLEQLPRQIRQAKEHTLMIIEKSEQKKLVNWLTITKLEKENQIIATDVCDIRENCRQIYNGLIDVYAEICHPDNWKYADRIVYYLSTGRADTLRDALNLMDQRLNAELIADAIRVSSEMIFGEIRRASTAIVSAVALSAERICDATNSAANRITASNDRVVSELARSNELAAANLETNRQLVNAQELNNALQAKANRSMEELLNDYQVVNNRVKY